MMKVLEFAIFTDVPFVESSTLYGCKYSFHKD